MHEPFSRSFSNLAKDMEPRCPWHDYSGLRSKEKSAISDQYIGKIDVNNAGSKLVKRLQDAAECFQNSVATISVEMRGVLRLGVMDAMLTNSAWPLHQVIEKFSRKARETVVDLTLIAPTKMENALLDRRRDVVIGPFRNSMLVCPTFRFFRSVTRFMQAVITRFLVAPMFQLASLHSMVWRPRPVNFSGFPLLKALMASETNRVPTLFIFLPPSIKWKATRS